MSELERRLEQSLKLADKSGRSEVKKLTRQIALTEAKIVGLQAKVAALRAKLAAARVSVAAEEMRKKAKP